MGFGKPLLALASLAFVTGDFSNLLVLMEISARGEEGCFSKGFVEGFPPMNLYYPSLSESVIYALFLRVLSSKGSLINSPPEHGREYKSWIPMTDHLLPESGQLILLKALRSWGPFFTCRAHFMALVRESHFTLREVAANILWNLSELFFLNIHYRVSWEGWRMSGRNSFDKRRGI